MYKSFFFFFFFPPCVLLASRAAVPLAHKVCRVPFCPSGSRLSGCGVSHIASVPVSSSPSTLMTTTTTTPAPALVSAPRCWSHHPHSSLLPLLLTLDPGRSRLVALGWFSDVECKAHVRRGVRHSGCRYRLNGGHWSVVIIAQPLPRGRVVDDRREMPCVRGWPRAECEMKLHKRYFVELKARKRYWCT